YTPPSDQLIINAPKATTWSEGNTSVIQIDVPVSIELDETKMTARSAVIWLTPLEGALAGQHRVEIVLVGDAKLNQPNGIATAAARSMSCCGSGRPMEITSRCRRIMRSFSRHIKISRRCRRMR